MEPYRQRYYPRDCYPTHSQNGGLNSMNMTMCGNKTITVSNVSLYGA